MEILITGATGFIGSRVSSMLVERGYNVKHYIGEINNPPLNEDYFKTTNIVLHLAAKNDEVRKGRENDDYISVNVSGTKNVADLCLKYNCKLMYFSSVVAGHPKEIYGLSKYFAEQLIRLYGARYGLKAIIVRPYGIYDERGRRRSGNPVNDSRGRNYPLTYRLGDIKRIIEKDNFSNKVRIFTTVLFWEHGMLYWPRKIFDKIRNIT